MKKIASIILLSLLSFPVCSQTREAVLDFEADRIGGERSGPFQSFLQGTQGPSFDTLLYMRKDFVDFQKQEYQLRRVRRGGRIVPVRGLRERPLFRREAGDY